jgi:glycosyltransferase involved in cell wall biosynthesis
MVMVARPSASPLSWWDDLLMSSEDKSLASVLPGECVLFATADWDEPYWTNKQHTAKTLAQLGWKVLYVESFGLRRPSVSSGKDWKRIWNRLWRGLRCLALGPYKAEKDIWILSPLAIPGAHGHPLFGRLNTLFIRSPLRRFLVSKKWSKPLIWTYHPFMLELLGAGDCGKVVYHCVDDLGAVPMINSAMVNAAEEKLLEQCDAVFVTNENLLSKCQPFNSNSHFFPNVVDFEHFSKARANGPLPADLAAIPEPRIVYMGVLSDFKVDFRLIFDVALARPDWNWVIIGTEREGQKSEWIPRLRALANVNFLGRKAYQDLPTYLADCQVGVLPTLCNDYTRSMFPMKFYEYLAAGLPVAATPLDFTKQALDGVEIGGTDEELVAAIQKQLTRGKLTDKERDRFIGDNTWHSRCARMLSCVNI